MFKIKVTSYLLNKSSSINGWVAFITLIIFLGDKSDLIFVEQVLHLVEEQMLLKEKLALKKKWTIGIEMRETLIMIDPYSCPSRYQ